MKKQYISHEAPPKVNIIGIPVSAVTMDTALDYVAENLNRIRGEYICAANVHTTVMAYEDETYKAVQSGAVLALPDGKPLSWVGKQNTTLEMEKTTGTHFLQNILSDDRFVGKKHYFYGTRQEDLERMIPQIRKDYPNACVCGCEPSLFRELTDEEVAELVNRINTAEADFIWIALGAPRQEMLMHRMRGMVNGVMTGVGGAFHILAGTIPDAPAWMQSVGLEWLFRLWKEPRRLFKRYLITNSKFIFYILRGRNHV